MIDPIYVGNDALEQLVSYCQAQNLRRFALVADTNTYQALGEHAEKRLQAQGYAVTSIVLQGEEIIADEPYLIHTLLNAPLGECTFLAVGSGTITDITRFVSHRSGRAFISLPTAPSVDGFTSIGAPLVLHGVKQTINCQAPIALFADLTTLCQAPQRLIAAGYGDMLAKLTSLADWRLGTLLWNEPFNEAIYQRTWQAVETCLGATAAIGQRSEAGVRQLMDALIESGLSMLELGNSRPASGAEHHASHYWEMKLLQEHRPSILHGAKVGVAVTLVAERYATLRSLSRAEMLSRLEAAELPARQAEIQCIQQGYGHLAETVIQEHRAFLDLTPAEFDQVKQRIVAQWDAIQTIAASVPPPDEIISYLREAGAVTDAQTLGLHPDEVPLGFRYGHYLRNRFTILKLNNLLGI